MFELHKKVVMIVGATGGIGEAIARASLEQGANVIIVSRTRSKVDSLVYMLSEAYSDSTVTGDIIDLSNASDGDYERLFKGKSIDHFILIAGSSDTLPVGPPGLLDMLAVRKSIEMRLTATIGIINALINFKVLALDGSIILTAGASMVKPAKGWSVLSAITASIDYFAKALAVELAPIRVNSVIPGMVDTDLWGNDRKQVAQLCKSLPVGHIGNPTEIAMSYIMFMCNTYATGSRVLIDGGGALQGVSAPH
jgi:NAD(P)-dependent dehydrogenase (short-subunit alcohol dehydrogenase family)